MGVFDRRVKHKNGTVSVMRYIRWYLPGGKAVTRSLGPASEITKTAAKEILAQESGQDKKKKRHGQLMYEDVTLAKFEPSYIRYVKHVEKKRSWNRDVCSLKNLTKEFGSKYLSQIMTTDLYKYREKRIGEGVTPRTVNLEMSCLSKLIKVAIEQGHFVGDNPVSKIKQFEIQNNTDRILSLKEEEKLIKSSSSHLKYIIICALNTGMRRGEIISLKWSMVNLKTQNIHLIATNTKAKKERKVPLNSEMIELFEELSKNKKSEYVFVNASGKPYNNANGIRTSFESAKRKAEIDNLRFHDLRHTAATRMVESGVPLFQVGQILGHSDPKTTMRYAHPDESLKKAVEALVSYKRTNYRNSQGNKDEKNGENTDVY